MKAIKHNGVITGIRSRVDGSIAYTVATGETSSEEKTAFFELHNQNAIFLINPLEEVATEVIKIDKEAGEKSPSQRLRSILYRIWEQSPTGSVSFEEYYRNQMEKLIEKLKERLDQ